MVFQRPQSPSYVVPEIDYIAGILSQVASQASAPARASSKRDQLALYLKEDVSQIAIIEYWRSKEIEWPQLVAMAFDFMVVPAMSSECKRIFSSCAKITTPESSRLSGQMLWHQQCLKNWQRQGAIVIAGAYNAVLLDPGKN
jgi:hypothetical protein